MNIRVLTTFTTIVLVALAGMLLTGSTTLAQRGTPPPNEQMVRTTETATVAATATIEVQGEQVVPTPTAIPTPTEVATEQPTATPESVIERVPEPTMPTGPLPQCYPGGPEPCGGK